jgi:hypothetical protein
VFFFVLCTQCCQFLWIVYFYAFVYWHLVQLQFSAVYSNFLSRLQKRSSIVLWVTLAFQLSSNFPYILLYIYGESVHA